MTSSLHTLALDTQSQNKTDTYFHHQQFPVEYTDKFDFHIAAPTQLPPLNDLDHAHAHALFNNSNPQDDLMHPNSWDLSQLASRLGRFSHQREPSLSSLASSGPVSPFSQHLSNPHISFNDSNGDAIMDMHGHELPINPGGSYYQMAKHLDSYQNYQNLDNTGVSEMAYPVTISGPMSNQRHRLDRSLLPAPEFVSGSSRSHPASVASSVAGDSPATPTVGEADSGDRRRQGRRPVTPASLPDTENSCVWPAGYNAPKLDRTMTDVYGDELYSPNFTITSSSPAQPTTVPVMSNNGVFNQRISAANTQHLSAAHHSPSTVSRDISPFRHGSPLAPSPSHEWINRGNMQLNPAQRMREQNKARRDARVAQQKQRPQRPQPPHQHQRQKSDFATPQTISPKDAMLDFNDADEDTQLPLFPPNSTDYGMDHLSSAVHGTGNFSTGNQVDFTTQPQLPATIHIPQRYPFVAQSHPLRDVSLPRHSSRDSNSTRAETQTPVQGRPANVGADSGTYTCTYHGCTLRFETPSLLQKHKREGHRQTHGLGGVRHQETSMAPGVMNSQAGPHRCDRINPSTGKPCNTIFSRPYDLTRHEDTIHNARKQKVHCNLCTEDKTFSRADALTRHFRVCHPDVELPGKHRRRGGS